MTVDRSRYTEDKTCTVAPIGLGRGAGGGRKDDSFERARKGGEKSRRRARPGERASVADLRLGRDLTI